jgi:hypothetical protein
MIDEISADERHKQRGENLSSALAVLSVAILFIAFASIFYYNHEHVAVPSMQVSEVSTSGTLNPLRDNSSPSVPPPQPKLTPEQQNNLNAEREFNPNAQNAADDADSDRGNAQPLSSNNSQSASDHSNSGAFTIGSTEEELIQVMGSPSSITNLVGEKLMYFDTSSVTVKDGKVFEYSDRGNLKVEVSSKSKSTGPFTMGSSEDDVIATMGTPSSISNLIGEKLLYFNLSSVTIKDGKVFEYSDRGNLKVVVRSKSKSIRPFGVGSSEDDVIAIMGTPSSISNLIGEKLLYFNLSSVTIKDGKVFEYSNKGNLNLK